MYRKSIICKIVVKSNFFASDGLASQDHRVENHLFVTRFLRINLCLVTMECSAVQMRNLKFGQEKFGQEKFGQEKFGQGKFGQ